jgi:hypothetical protein
MTQAHLVGLVTGCFALAYAALDYVAYQSVMFLVLAPATISSFVGALAHWQHLGEVTPRRAVRAGLLAGCMSALLILALDIAPDRYSPSGLSFHLAVFVASPAVVTWGLLMFLRRGQRRPKGL